MIRWIKRIKIETRKWWQDWWVLQFFEWWSDKNGFNFDEWRLERSHGSGLGKIWIGSEAASSAQLNGGEFIWGGTASGRGSGVCIEASHVAIMGVSGSVWKSSQETRKEPDQTLTDQDWKYVRPMRTETTVWSLVHLNLEFVMTNEKPVWTSLNWSFSPQI